MNKSREDELRTVVLTRFAEQLNKTSFFLFLVYLIILSGLTVMMLYFFWKFTFYIDVPKTEKYDLKDIYFCSFIYLMTTILPFLGSTYFSLVEKDDELTKSEISYSILMRAFSIFSIAFILLLFYFTFLEVVDVVIPDGKPLALILATFGVIKNLEFYFLLRNKYGPINLDKLNKKER